MSNDLSREEILEQLQVQTLGELEDQLLKIIEEDKENLVQPIFKAKEGIDSGNTDEALKTLVATLGERFKSSNNKEGSTQETDHTIPWINAVHDLCFDIEDRVVLPQEEERFQGLPSDSAFIKIRKFGKRSILGLQKAGRTLGSIFKSEKEPAPVWKQSIPLQQTVAFYLLDVSPVLKKWSHQLQQVQAELLLETDAWTLHSSGLIQLQADKEETDDVAADQKSEAADDQPSEASFDQIPNQEDMESFFQEALDHLDAFQKEIEEELSNKLRSIHGDIVYSLSVTDTIERSASYYDRTKLIQKEQKILLSDQQDMEKWAEIVQALLNRCRLSMDFMTLYNQCKERIDGFGESLETFFTDNFESPAHTLLEQLKEAEQLFEDSEDRSVKEIHKLSGEHLQRMNDHVEKNLLKPGRELIENAILGTKLERFTSAIPEWTKNQREQAVLVEELDMTVSPPRFQLETVEWQSLVQRVLNNQLSKEFVPKQVKPEEFLSKIHQEIQEIAQIILTNIEIADEVKKTDEEEPFQVAKEGLERARVKLEEVITKISNKKKELRDKLTEKKQISFSKLAMLLEKQNVNELRLAGAQYMAKETAVDWKIKFQVYWAKVAEKSELFARFLWRKIKSYYEAVSKFLGFDKAENLEGDTTDLATYLSETDEQIASLPFIYRRLFDFHKEVEDRFYIRKPEQFDRLKKGYELWQNNFPSSFSIVGEKGSGKSLFTRMLMNEVLTKHDVIEINFPDTIWKPEEVVAYIAKGLKIDEVTTFEELTAAIQRKKKRVVVILENVQNCFIRNLSGFDAMEQLLLLISETNKEILWTVSSTRYGWLYLDKVLNVVDYFTHAVETDNLTPQQVEELILRRHRASGYQLTFLPDESTKNSRNYKKHLDDEEKSQEYLKDRYFEKLAKLAEGNSSVAMINWIRSIKEHDDTHFYINPLDLGAMNRLQELDSNELFALAAYILHDSLTAEELSMATHQSKRESQLTASRLSSQSILVQASHGFAINQLIYRQIARALKEANFIH